jgi:hypothetical protein
MGWTTVRFPITTLFHGLIQLARELKNSLFILALLETTSHIDRGQNRLNRNTMLQKNKVC